MDSSLTEIEQIEKEIARNLEQDRYQILLNILESIYSRIESIEKQNTELKNNNIKFHMLISEFEKETKKLATTLKQGSSFSDKITEAESSLFNLQNSIDQFQKVTQNSSQQLHRVAENSASWIAEAVKSLKVDDFRHLTFERLNQIEEVSSKAEKKISEKSRWFQWESLFISLVIAVIVSMFTGLFINDESPWETRQNIIKERAAGKTLLKVWPKLSANERLSIQSFAADISSGYNV